MSDSELGGWNLDVGDLTDLMGGSGKPKYERHFEDIAVKKSGYVIDLFGKNRQDNAKTITKFLKTEKYRPAFATYAYTDDTSFNRRVETINDKEFTALEKILWKKYNVLEGKAYRFMSLMSELRVSTTKKSTRIVNHNLNELFPEEIQNIVSSYIRTGKPRKDLAKLMKKVRTVLPKLNDVGTVDELFDPNVIKRNKSDLKKYFHKNELLALEAFWEDQSDFDEYNIITRMEINQIANNVDSIRSKMREGIENCVKLALKKKLGHIPNFDDVEYYAPDDGMDYDDIQEYLQKISAKTNVELTLKIKDRNGEQVHKTTVGSRKAHQNQQAKATLYQYNNHADVKNLDMQELYRYHTKIIDGKWQTQPIYLNDVEIAEQFGSYAGARGVIAALGNKSVDIQCWWNKDHIYLLDTPELDRNVNPYELTSAGMHFKTIRSLVPPMVKDHTLKNYFVNMARKMPIGLVRKNEELTQLEVQNIRKIDMNKAYKNYWNTPYHQGMPSAPMEQIYQATNSILDQQISGHLIVQSITPSSYFNEALNGRANDVMSLTDGIITIAEAKWMHDNDFTFDIIGFIPSMLITDNLKPFLTSFSDDQKFIVNKLIGKMLSKKKTTLDVTSDPEEAKRLYSYYYNKGQNPILHEVTIACFGSDEIEHPTSIISAETGEIEHSPYAFLHNYIIGCVRIQLWEKTKELINLGAKIISYRIDSIAYTFPDEPVEFQASSNILKGWKQEHMRPSFNPLTEYAISQPELIKGGGFGGTVGFPKWSSVLGANFISLEAPAGYGKTHFVRELLSNSLILCPTHSAAALIPGAITLDSYISALEHYNATFKQTLVIDEMSMIDMNKLKKLERLIRKGLRTDIPWGGLQVVISGDPAQLPPVAPILDHIFVNGEKVLRSKATKQQITEYDSGFQNIYEILKTDPTAGFGRPVAQLNTSNYFKICHRSDDHVHVELSNNLREAILRNKKSEIKAALDDIMKMTRCVDKINKELHLDTTFYSFTNKDTEIINDALIKIYNPKKIKVVLKETKELQRDGEKVKFYNNQFGILENGIITTESGQIAASKIDYIPAYAMTAHLSQGQSVQGKVLINLKGMKDPRMIYTCFTRVRKLDNITLLNPT